MAHRCYTVVSPSAGVRKLPGDAKHPDPEIQRLFDRLKVLEGGTLAPANIAVYLHEVGPIVAGLLAQYGHEGAIEIATLREMPDGAFAKHRLNDLLFGPEGERPTTAAAIRSRMNDIIERASSQVGEAARILNGVANEILASVDVCEKYCAEHIRVRHLKMDDPQDSDPKRYSRRDLSALAFTGTARREEYKQLVAEQQQRAMTAIPQMLEAQERRDQQWMSTLSAMSEAQERREAQWAGVFAEMSEALQAIAGKPKKPKGDS